jgi:TfoX/Sxy family transcriptional regulator of competence genes
MDADGLKELFTPFGGVTVKRMFGGHGASTLKTCVLRSSRAAKCS